MKKKGILLLLNLLAFLSGCTGVGSEYTKPEITVPAQWTHPTHPIAVSTDDAWWRHFHDPILNELIEKKSIHNLDLQMVKERIEIARAEYNAAVAQLFPTFGGQAFPPNGTGVNLTQVIGLLASIEVDIFGRLRQTMAATAAILQAEQAQCAFTVLNLYAEIATTYLEFREAQAKESLLTRNIHANQETLALLKSRYKKAGLVRYLDIAQQESLIETELADRDKCKAMMSVLLHKLEILTGQMPGTLSTLLLPYQSIPEIKQPIHLGIPSDMLRRRQDIIVAERRVAASHANVRVAIASLFPKISVGWILGWQTETLASNLFALQNPDSTFYGIFNAPLLNLGLYRHLDIQKQQKVLAIVQYQLAIIKALNEVETQYDYSVHFKESASHLKRAVEQKRLVLKLAKDAYSKGAYDFNVVLHAEEEVNHLEMLYLHDLVIYETARVNLYKALGGDFK